MDIHQCMTCGERWGVGTSVFGARAAKHQAMGHHVLIGDDQVLTRQAEEWGTPIGNLLTEPLAVYRCLDCDEIWVLGSEEACDQAIAHKGQGHQVFQGDETDMRELRRPYIEVGPQTPNPLDPNSVAGKGTVLTLGGAS